MLVYNNFIYPVVSSRKYEYVRLWENFYPNFQSDIGNACLHVERSSPLRESRIYPFGVKSEILFGDTFSMRFL